MKTLVKIALAVLLCALMALGSACRGKTQDALNTEAPEVTEAPADPTETVTEAATEEPTAEPTEEPTAEPTAEPTEEPTEAPEATIEEKVARYAESLAAEMQQVKESLEGVMDFDFFAEGKSIVMQYGYLTEDAADAEALAAALDAQAEVYKPIYRELSENVGSDEVSVILRYLTVDGEKIIDYVVDKDYDPAA